MKIEGIKWVPTWNINYTLGVDGISLPLVVLTGFVCLLAMLILTRLDIPKLSEKEIHDPGRPLAKIMRQPEFVVAVLASMLSYGIMNLMMTSTPLAMRAHDHHFNDAAMVLEWHVFGMYGPSFFTGSLIKRFGTVPVMLVGAALNAGAAGAALSGIAVANFWWAMVLLGVGWNFLYIGATTLLTETYRPEEKAKVQGINDMTIFATLVLECHQSFGHPYQPFDLQTLQNHRRRKPERHRCGG